MRKLTLAILLLLSPVLAITAPAKDNLDLIKADYYFAHLAFFKAIPYYEKLAEEGKNAHVYSRLGDCYRLTGDITRAEEYYHKVIDMKRATEAVKLKYAKVLMQLMRYEEAEKWLKEYREANPRDRRVANMIEGCRTAPGILKTGYKGSPVLLALNTDRSEFAPSLWNGNLVYAADTAIGISKRTNNWTGSSCYNIYAVPCDGDGNCTDEVTSPGTTGKVNIEWHDGPATFNAAGDTMYFTRTRYNEKFFARGAIPNKDSIVVLEAMMATDYDEVTQKFTRVKPMAFNRKSYSVAYPTLSSSGNIMIFSSTMNGNGSDLFMTRRNKKGKWMRPLNLGLNVNTEGEEVFPRLIDDSTLVFASDGHPGLGGLDIFVSHWDRATNAFLPPTNIGMPANSSYDDMSMALSPDGSGYFSSNRPADKASDNIYFYRKN